MVQPENAGATPAPESPESNYQQLLAELASLRQENEELRFLATHNPVTELWNERGLHEQFPSLQEAFPDTSIAVIVLNLENFGAVNDTLGRTQGDELLRQVGNGLTEKTGEGIVAHTHDDEYIVCRPLAHDDNPEASDQDRIDKIIESLEEVTEDLKAEMPVLGHYRFGVSAGGVVIENDMTLEDAIKKAGQSMNMTKNARRQAFVERHREVLFAIAAMGAGIGLTVGVDVLPKHDPTRTS